MKRIKELFRGDKIRIFGCVGYFCGLTTYLPKRVFIIHVADLTGEVRRFKLFLSQQDRFVEVLTPYSRTAFERIDLLERFGSERPTLQNWLF